MIMTSFKQTFRLTKGFTLAETMVVISIIGILATVGYINYNDSKILARDKIRSASIKQLQVAINAYKDTHGKYPEAGCGPGNNDKWVGPGPRDVVQDVSCTNYIAGLVPDFISALPTDPKSENEPDKGFMYRTDSSQQSYKLLINQSVEENFITSYTQDLARCQSDCSRPYCNTTPGQNPQKDTYGVYSSGAKCW